MRFYILLWFIYVSCIEFRVDYFLVVINVYKFFCCFLIVVCEVLLFGLEERICYFFSDFWDVFIRYRVC